MYDIDQDWQEHVFNWAATGSRVICSPPPTDTDEDYVCFHPHYENAIEKLHSMGFISEGSPEFYTGNDNGRFRSLRRNDLNLILTDQSEFYKLFCSATELARRFNLTDKTDRIALFQAVLYGVGPHSLQVVPHGEPLGLEQSDV